MKPRYIFIAFCLLCTSTALKAQTVNDFSTGLTKHVTKEDSINYILSDTIILDRSAVTGDNITDPIEVGTYSVSFSYTDTRNTFYPYTNKYGQYTRDVFYRLVLTVPMNVTFTHEGSALSDTYMHLLDSAGNRIALNDDYSGEGHCNNTQHSYINRMLAAGTYYVVSEGFNRNGNVTTNITGYASTTFNYPSIPSSYSTMPGTAVGGMGATVCVSPMGGATCSIPIEIPVGLGDMQPNLSIVYNSQSGNGMCGYGANLSGISVITRGVKDIYHDESAQGMKYLADDALYLDGVRLILASGTEGQEGAVYTPESDPFTKVISHGTCTTTSNNTWFEVRATNGIIYRYGYNDNTRLTYTEGNSQRIYAWYIYRAQRTIGNHMTYSYLHNDNCLYPYQIFYGGNIIQNTAHPNVVEFTYETRNDSVPIRFDGHKGSMKKRLKTITTKTNNSTYRTYNLNYNTTGDGTAYKFSRLSSVTEKNGQNESLPSTQLNWSYLPSVGYSSNTPAIQSMVSMNNKVNEPTFAACDLNGDGIDDIIGFGKSGESNDKKLYLYKYLSQKTNNGNVNHYDTIAQTITPSYTILEGDYPDYFFNAVDQSGIGGASSVDYNGDGINELMIGHRYCSISYGVFPNDTIEDYLEFIMIKDDSHVYVNKTLLRTNCSPLYSVGDIDNDGRTDIVVLETVRDLSGLAKLHILSNSVAPSDYAAFDIFDNPVSFSLDCDVYLRNVPERMFLSDMNGNGMTDLLILYDNGYDILWNRGGGISSSNLIYLNGYYDNAYHHHGTELENYNTVTAGDFNGDGMLDVLTNARNSSKWYLHTCNGDGTFNRILALDSSDLGDQDFTERDNNKICNVVDFDGDGRSDVIVTKGIYEIETDILGNEWGEFDHVLTKWLCSTGASFEEKHSATSMRYDDMNSKKYITGDFDGDGHVELVNYGYDCVNGNNSDSDPVWRIYKNSNLTVQSGKVTSVTGDFGVTTSITYSTLADQSVYTRGAAEPYPAPRYTIPMNVVKQTIQNNGAAGNQTVNYSYAGLKIHLQGKGLLGFNKTIADNATTGVKTESGISQWDNTFYIPKITYSKTTIDSLIAQTINTLDIVDKDETKYFAYPSVIVNTNMDGYSTTTHRHYNINHGYIISDTTFYGTNMFRATRYHNYTEAGAAFHPQTIVTGQRHPDDDSGAFTRTTTYVYDNHGFVARKTENKFSEDSLVTEYAYDLYGNMERQTSTGSGITTPCTTRYSYDDTHRFPLRVYTDPASSVHKYTYDLWGNVLTELDSINASRTDTISKNTYDGWGNIVRTEIPGRGEVTYTWGWNSDAGKRYFVLTQGTARPWVKTWFDNQGRKVCTESVGVKDVEIVSATSYNIKGQVEKRLEKEGDLSLTFKYWYDIRGRIIQEEAPGSSVITYTYSSNGSEKTVSEDDNGNSTTTVYDAWGNVKSVTDPISNTVMNKYSSNGGIKETISGGATWSFQYDDRGNRTSMTDPDAGTTTYTYDALGRETSRTDGRGVVFLTNYDYLGRVTSVSATKSGQTETITYTYGGSTSGAGQMRLISESNGMWTKSYTYDGLGRITGETMSKGNTISKSRSYTYDSSNGLLSSRTMPGGKTILYSYDDYGNTTGVNFESGTIAWSLDGYTGRRTISSTVLDDNTSFEKIIVLDQYGNLDSIKTDGYQYEKYVFDPIRGNLTQKQGMADDYPITYTYDNADRLLTATDTDGQRMAVTYAANGNIMSKTDIGSYTYGSSSRPHAVTIVDNTKGIIGYNEQVLEYNSWGKITNVDQDLYSYNVEYGPDLQRVKSTLDKSQHTEYEKFYWDDYEEKTSNGLTTRYWYINGPNGLIGIYTEKDTQSGTEEKASVALTDHLGSIVGLCDNDDIFYVAAYDEWGYRYMEQAVFTSDLFDLDRGFCGHEHIEELGLINMNGRMYDPLLGRFLSPDPFVQSPTNPQNYNRYSYCLNNPLKYTDPDGEWFWIPAVIIGAYLGGSSVNGTFNPGDWDYSNWQTYAGIAVGGLAGYAGAAIGASVAASAVAGGASTISAGVAGGMMGGMVSGGINGAGMTAIMGGNLTDIMYNMTTGMVMGGFGGAISGGIGAAIGDYSGVAGGSFKNGMYELGHSALKGAATGLAEGAMMAAMEQDASYLWKGALMGAALNTGMAGLRIAALGTTFIPDSKYGSLEDYGQVYRRGSIFMKKGSGITIGRRNASVKLKGHILEDRYLLQHETGHIAQINEIGNAKFYSRTAKEYIVNPGFFDAYTTPGTLEYDANFYAFQRLGYYYDIYSNRITTFP